MKSFGIIQIFLIIFSSLQAQTKTEIHEMKSLSPNLMVDNVQETIDYYVDHFGFKFIQGNPPEGNYIWAMVQSGEVTLMFQARESLEEDIPELKGENPGGGFSLFIVTENLKELYEKVKDKVDIVVDFKKTFYNMYEFTIRDLNGYLLTFAEEAKD